MIIDFHTHVFAEKIAHAALENLSMASRSKYFVEGTKAALLASMEKAGIDKSVLLTVITKPSQTEKMNRQLLEAMEEEGDNSPFVYFGGIHPDNENVKAIVKNLSENGVKGIKIHPVYNRVNIDDLRFLRIIDAACENDMIVITHAGYDVGIPGEEHSAVSHITSMLDQLHPEKMVLAHMGGWQQWEEVADRVAGRKGVYLDTAFSLLPIVAREGSGRRADEEKPLAQDVALSLMRSHGIENILFGTDSPWDDQKKMVAYMRGLPLSEQELQLILGGNARRLLGL